MTLYFNRTLKDGGNKTQCSSIIEILQHENRLLYFIKNRISLMSKKSKHLQIK